MGAWEKLQLGWLDHRSVPFGQDTTVKLGPADLASGTASQAVVVTLPDKTVTTAYNTPHGGATEWWSGSSSNLTSTLSRTIDLTAATTSANVSAWLQNDTEEGFDHLYGEVSSDGRTWAPVGDPITGTFGWAQKSWDLSAFAGTSIQFRFRYSADGGVNQAGSFLDDLAVNVNGAAVFTDSVEGGDNGWTASGFTRMSGSTTVMAAQYYIAENRVYSGYDQTLRTGPYNFGFATTRPDWVERFPYQNGLLVWYVDGQYQDNNTSAHPGRGQALPVDAHPAPITFADGVLLGNRRQPFDATFGHEATDAVTFHRKGVALDVPSQPAIATFDDRDPNRYWSATNPWSSVKVAGTGTSMTVTKTRDGGNELQVKVAFR